jgi:hypothetical protein
MNEGLRDDVIPEEFGRDNVRIVEGLILMFVGFGGLITNEIIGKIKKEIHCIYVKYNQE